MEDKINPGELYDNDTLLQGSNKGDNMEQANEEKTQNFLSSKVKCGLVSIGVREFPIYKARLSLYMLG